VLAVAAFEKSSAIRLRAKRKAGTLFENAFFVSGALRSNVVDLVSLKFKRLLKRANHLIWESSNRRSN
jgi:hypothetical protein